MASSGGSGAGSNLTTPGLLLREVGYAVIVLLVLGSACKEGHAVSVFVFISIYYSDNAAKGIPRGPLYACKRYTFNAFITFS